MRERLLYAVYNCPEIDADFNPTSVFQEVPDEVQHHEPWHHLPKRVCVVLNPLNIALVRSAIRRAHIIRYDLICSMTNNQSQP